MFEKCSNEHKRAQFEIGLQEKYIMYADNNIKMQNRNKQERELEKVTTLSNKTVVVKNMLHLIAL